MQGDVHSAQGLQPDPAPGRGGHAAHPAQFFRVRLPELPVARAPAASPARRPTCRRWPGLPAWSISS